MSQNINQHIIILVQLTGREGTRSYYDYTSWKDASEGIIGLYEDYLKKINKGVTAQVTYDVQDLFAYLDKLGDISALSYVYLFSYQYQCRINIEPVSFHRDRSLLISLKL
jgi:Enhancer of rudimentary